MNIFDILFICAILFPLNLSGVQSHFHEIKFGANLTDFMYIRKRRSLIYANSGQMKFSIGPSMPVTLDDPITWRSLVCSYTLQGGHYPLPTVPLYPWDKWEHTYARALQRVEVIKGDDDALQPDGSRLFVYTALETFLNRQSGSGRSCLLRAICQNAQVDQHIGIFSEILDVVLTPGKEPLDATYKEAHMAGVSGVDCYKMYKKCPEGANLLDRYIDYF